MRGALFVLAGVVACSGGTGGAAKVPAAAGASSAPAAAALDTARGVVTIVGAEPATSVTLASDGGVLALASQGSDSLLRHVAGLEVLVEGVRTADLDRMASPRGAPVFQVRRFTVRASGGAAAVDGVLELVGGAYSLRLADGRSVAIGALPPSLKQSVGARIWLAGPLDRAPASYGVIAGKP